MINFNSNSCLIGGVSSLVIFPSSVLNTTDGIRANTNLVNHNIDATWLQGLGISAYTKMYPIPDNTVEYSIKSIKYGHYDIQIGINSKGLHTELMQLFSQYNNEVIVCVHLKEMPHNHYLIIGDKHNPLEVASLTANVPASIQMGDTKTILQHSTNFLPPSVVINYDFDH